MNCVQYWTVPSLWHFADRDAGLFLTYVSLCPATNKPKNRCRLTMYGVVGVEILNRILSNQTDDARKSGLRAYLRTPQALHTQKC